MDKIFPQSKELKQLIESHEWDLYDSTMPEGRIKPFTWEEFQERGPAKEFVTGNNYLFAPIPKQGVSLRNSYINAGCMGLCFQLDNIEQHIDMDGEGAHIVNGKITYVFSRLGVEHYERMAAVSLFTPPSAMPNTPILIIPFRYVLEKFQKHFRIISTEEYYGGLEHPDFKARIN
ncbi:hypothetical protein A3K73_05400 [Candidatus Pacearchaeota archaeon RBG_13_36_9]|nr:MAG: hypothetical protein A3K73_05400 [Candidatus Pacearchaeota archaeon RBG_13_36_9]